MIFKEKGKRKRKEAKAKHIRISIYHNQTVLQYHSFFLLLRSMEVSRQNPIPSRGLQEFTKLFGWHVYGQRI